MLPTATLDSVASMPLRQTGRTLAILPLSPRRSEINLSVVSATTSFITREAARIINCTVNYKGYQVGLSLFRRNHALWINSPLAA